MIIIKYLLLPLLALFLNSHLHAQGIDSATFKKLQESLKVSKDSLKTTKDSLKITKDSLKVVSTKLAASEKNDGSGCTGKPLGALETTLVWFPIVLFILFTIIFIYWMDKSGFTLDNALSVAPTPEQFAAVAQQRAAVANQAAMAAKQGVPVTVPTIPDPQPQRSTSRLLAFITGLIAIIIAVCLVSYHGYALFAGCSGEKQLDSLWKILAGLGIGVIPYGINVWNGNAKETPNPKS